MNWRNHFCFMITVTSQEQLATIYNIYSWLITKIDAFICFRTKSENQSENTLLIGPIFIDVELTNNLAYNWYKEQVKLDMSATVRVVPVSLILK